MIKCWILDWWDYFIDAVVSTMKAKERPLSGGVSLRHWKVTRFFVRLEHYP